MKGEEAPLLTSVEFTYLSFCVKLTINLFVILEPISPNVIMKTNGLLSKILSGELDAIYDAGTNTRSNGIIGVITLVP